MKAYHRKLEEDLEKEMSEKEEEKKRRKQSDRSEARGLEKRKRGHTQLYAVHNAQRIYYVPLTQEMLVSLHGDG